MPADNGARNSRDSQDLATLLAALPPEQRARLEIELSKRTTSTTIKTVRERQAERKQSYLGKLQTGGGKGSVFCFLFSGGFQMELSTFANLARLIGPDYSFYAVIARGTDGKSEPHKDVEEMAAAYIQEIISVEPAGPYFLIGECLSAPVAYETARQLRLQGKQIGLLALLGASGRVPWFSRYLGSWLGARIRYYRNKRSPNPAGVPAAWQSKHVKRAQRAYGLAVRRYQPRPYDGKLVIDRPYSVESMYSHTPH